MHSVMWGGVGAIVGVWALRCARHDIIVQRRRGTVFAEYHSAHHTLSWVVSASVGLFCAVIANHVFSNQTYVVLCCVLVGTGLRMSWVDIDTHTIPQRVMGQSAIAAGTVVLFLIEQSDDVTTRNVALSVGMMWIIFRLIEFGSRGQLGHADVVCAAYVGLFIGTVNPEAVWVAIFAAFFVAGVVALILVLSRISSRHSNIPFGPFLFFGAMYAVLR